MADQNLSLAHRALAVALINMRRAGEYAAAGFPATADAVAIKAANGFRLFLALTE